MRDGVRVGKLLVTVTALSGRRYPPGTTVRFRGGGSTVDAFVGGDWLALSWWEMSPVSEPGEDGERPLPRGQGGPDPQP